MCFCGNLHLVLLFVPTEPLSSPLGEVTRAFPTSIPEDASLWFDSADLFCLSHRIDREPGENIYVYDNECFH